MADRRAREIARRAFWKTEKEKEADNALEEYYRLMNERNIGRMDFMRRPSTYDYATPEMRQALGQEVKRSFQIAGERMQDPVYAALAFGPATIKAYHGSPYKFSKFQLEKVGTGEGVQAFGHGLYFTEDLVAAKFYAQPKTPSGMRLNTTNIEHIKDLVKNKQISEAKEYALSLNHLYQRNQQFSEARDWAGIYNELVTKEKLPSWADASVYEVELHPGKTPSQYKYIDWYEKVPSKMFSKIEEQFRKENPDLRFGEYKDWFGNKQWSYYMEKVILDKPLASQMYHYLDLVYGGPKEASAFLRRVGINGIRYPTETIHAASMGKHLEKLMQDNNYNFNKVKQVIQKNIKDITNAGYDAKIWKETLAELETRGPRYNYVIFDEKDIAIRKVN